MKKKGLIAGCLFVGGAKGYEKISLEFETQLNKLGDEGWELVQRMDGMFFSKEKFRMYKER